jgi:cytochrome c2
LAWAPDGTLLFSVGDLEVDGAGGGPISAQDPLGDYGKILRLDAEGGRETLTMGHRNPQGLFVTEDGTIWATEHGPEGGDELNRIVPGANYGWPLATYGTEYGTQTWPLAEGRRTHESYEEPTYVWVPSIGVSSVIEVRGDEFPHWKGDLLIGSLASGSLYRARVTGNTIAFVERIEIGGRLRDLTQDSEGRVLIWRDDSVIVTVRNAGEVLSGEAIFSECARCHANSLDATAVGPTLRGVFGRRAGTLPGYDFSSALRNLDVVWTPDSLDAFLRAPQAVAPGSVMRSSTLSAAERQAVIDFLQNYR